MYHGGIHKVKYNRRIILRKSWAARTYYRTHTKTQKEIKWACKERVRTDGYAPWKGK